MDWTRGHTLGRGSSGATISIATSSQSGEVFAVKSAELHKSEFLQKEAKILSSLCSLHIIGYKGCGITRENSKLMYNLSMEYAPGGTLSDAIREHGSKLDEPKISYYARQILQGLENLHSNGVVHCDIKGSNILITNTGAKVADFGCAKRVNQLEPEAETTSAISGTPAFMAPEVARGEHQEFPSDIWSFGCTIIEMASGGSPWPNVSNPVSVIYRIAYSGALPEFPSCLSGEAKDFLSKCLKRNPNERWTASQLLKHPFLVEFNSQTKQVVQDSCAVKSSSNSPTSILDQAIWNSLEESESGTETESLANLGHSSRGNNSPRERVSGLALLCGEPTWDWDDESWFTIREGDDDAIMNDVEEKEEMICGSIMGLISSSLEEKQRLELLDFCVEDRYIISSRFNCGLSNCRTENAVISESPFHRDRDKLLIPSISSIL